MLTRRRDTHKRQDGGSPRKALFSFGERIHVSRGGRGNLKGIAVSQHHEPPQEFAMTITTATTTAATTTTPGLILPPDPGKYKTVACADAGSPDTARFESLVTDRDRLRKLFAKYHPATVVCEACALAG
jgi:hypothetical protein